MKYMRLIWANLLRRKTRTVLTVLSVAVALFLFAALRSVLTAFAAAGEVGSEARLVTRSAIGITFPLPQAYAQRISALDGVREVSWANWFGGVYVDPQNFFAQFAVNDTYFPMYPEVRIPSEQLQAFNGERTAAIVGQGLMDRFGWRMGQTVTLQGTIFPGDWDFTIRGVYVPDDPSFGDESFFFHYDYLLERTNRQITPGWFILQLGNPDAAAAVSAEVDALFENSSSPTTTETEKAFNAGFVTMWGNVSFLVRAIGTAVFFAILLLAANTMMMAARERIGEVAVLKTLGFSNGLLSGLVMTEAVTISLLGGVVGILGARAVLSRSEMISSIIPGYAIEWSTVALGLGVAALLGLASGLVPAIQAGRLSVVDAFRRVA